MSIFRTIVRNAASNWLGFAVQAAVAFFLTPLVVEYLGSARYGVWMLVISLTGYYGLLDLGFRSGLGQYLTRYLAIRDFDRLNKTASTGVAALVACAGLILVVSFGLSWLAPVVFRIPGETVDEVRLAILINGVAMAAQFTLFPFSAVFVATQRYDLANLIGIATRLSYAGAAYLCLQAGYGLVGLSAVVAVTNLLDYVARWQLAYRILPELHISLRLVNLHTCWEFMHFGLWNVLVNGSVRMIAYSSEILIGIFLTTTAIAPYALALSLTDYFGNLFGPLGSVVFPVATELDAQGKTETLRRVYLVSSRLMMLLATTTGLIAFFWAEDFYQLWLHNSISAQLVPTTSFLFHILIVGAVCTAGQRVGYQILLGSRRLKLLAALFTGEALANLVLSLCLMPTLGVVGVALGNLIPAVLFQAIVHPLVLTRILDIPWRSYVREVWVPVSLMGTILTGILSGFRSVGSAAGTWPALVLQVSTAIFLATFLVAVIGLNGEERARFLINPLRRLTGRKASERLASASFATNEYTAKGIGTIDASVVKS